MCISIRQNPPLKVPSWVLWIGLIGIINFVVGCWLLLPLREGSTVYFWFVEFYGYILFPSLIFFLFSMIIVVLALARSIKKSAAKAVILMAGMIISICVFLQAVGIAGFLSTLRVTGKVKQHGHYYYLVSYADESAAQYAFCESDAIGFAGKCRRIARSAGNDPKIYIDESTNLVTVESEKPPFIWINSFPPQCINVPYEDGEWYFGRCEP